MVSSFLGGVVYLLKLALRPWKLALFSQIFSAMAVGVLLVLVGFLFWMQQGLQLVVHRMQGEQVVTAYLDNTVLTGDEARLVAAIRNTLDSPLGVEIKIVTASQFVNTVKGQYPDLGRELEDLGREMYQIVPRYISISGILSASALDKIKRIPGIDSAESSKDRYHTIVGAFSALRWVARILMCGIGFALLTGLIHLTKMNAYLHRDALKLLRFWGAGATTLAGPGMISGTGVGLLGGAIAWSSWMTLGIALMQHIRSLSVMLKGMPPLHSNLALSLFILGGIMGFLAGLFGSLSSTHFNSDRVVSG